MPVTYEGIREEHSAVRRHVGMFDVSHMGQARLRGVSPLSAFEEVVPGDYIGLKPGRQKYSVLLNRTGGILDDLIIYRQADERFLVVANAANTDVVLRELRQRCSGDAVVTDETLTTGLISIQGPDAAGRLAAH